MGSRRIHIKAGHIEVLKDGEAYDSSPLPEARQIDLLLIRPREKSRNKVNRSKFDRKDQDSSVHPPYFRFSPLNLRVGFFC